jgi:hypothetical protein
MDLASGTVRHAARAAAIIVHFICIPRDRFYAVHAFYGTVDCQIATAARSFCGASRTPLHASYTASDEALSATSAILGKKPDFMNPPAVLIKINGRFGALNHAYPDVCNVELPSPR